MIKSKLTTGLTAGTFKKLQLNAGAFLRADYSAIEDAAELRTALVADLKDVTKCLGATRGGGTFVLTPQLRNIEADGKRYEFVGSTVNDGWQLQLTTTLIEITPENMKLAAAMGDIEEVSDTKRVIKVRTAIAEEDYIPYLSWVGDTSEGYVVITLTNALNTAGATLTFTDKGEGTLPLTLTAHQGTVDDFNFAPVSITYLSEAVA